jgi:hypothetical protein
MPILGSEPMSGNGFFITLWLVVLQAGSKLSLIFFENRLDWAHLNFCGGGVLLKVPVFTALSLAPCFSWVLVVVVTSEPLERFIGARKTAEAVVRSSSR